MDRSTKYHINTVKLLTTNRVFFSFIVSDRLFREKWPVYFSISEWLVLFIVLKYNLQKSIAYFKIILNFVHLKGRSALLIIYRK